MNARYQLLIAISAVLLTGCGVVATTGVRSSTPTPSIVASAAHGKALFRDKGCVTCHVNARVEGTTGVIGSFGPNLSNYTNDPAFLRRWLADPPAVRPGTPMPNLALSQPEIEDLIAFINQPR